MVLRGKKTYLPENRRLRLKFSINEAINNQADNSEHSR